MDKPFKPETRLIIQASIPVSGDTQGEILYNEIKVFLLSWHADITLNGQIMKMLEPCCKKKQETKNHEKSP